MATHAGELSGKEGAVVATRAGELSGKEGAIVTTRAGELSGKEGAIVTTRAGEPIRVKGLTRLYGERAVLDGLDLEIAPGEFVALLGQSGSGKSTLLRALAGLDADVAGAGLVEVPEQVSVVFQDARLLPWQRVLDNVILGLDGAVERGRRSLAEVGLAGRERAWPNELSGGEQQRVALARSLVREPRLLLADEPFGALDALTRLKMHGLLRRLFEEHRPAVLLVTHDVDEAIALADRVLVLDHGRIAAEQRLDVARSAAEVRAELLRALGVGEVPASRRDGRPHRDG
ncbi:ABC transporter ATP-binding protein [Nonomuraea sp. FMUSA5-5]|uniref:ABC transporter ATP-binding protein n=1 Tax=Nonomuraea composti TaxID=2720023 RepID=A0ABX1B7E9_9ACTN|nr:ABC transporter ATP-binding protein [Nonomuraea sp. FMUSA5-5]NJP92480.1 ABC transporter ATP-binding protein [Nonomuraea sp. FMUSA5-5]